MGLLEEICKKTYKSVVSWVCCVFLIPVQSAIVFGAEVLEHVLSLCRGNYDFLERLPVPLLLHIFSFLELEDVARLSQVSRRFEMVKKKIYKLF